MSENNAFAQVPEWTGSLSASYEFDLGPGSVFPRIDIAYQSESFMDAVNTASLKQDAYTLINASLAYRPENGPWEFKVFGKNLTDEEYFVGDFADLPDQGYAEAAIGRPLEWGVSLAVEF